MDKVLVVNNDMDMMSLLKRILEKRAFTVIYTGNHDEAIDIALSEPPGIILIDILQKEVLHELKMNDRTRHIPAILMTGYSLRDRQVETLADDVIEKPFISDVLFAKISKNMIGHKFEEVRIAV